MDGRLDLLGTPRAELAGWLDGLGVGAVHAPRVFGGVHRRGLPLAGIDGLGRHAARIEAASWLAAAVTVDVRRSDDGTEKLGLQLHDGALVEAVLVPMREDRTTLCISTQVGCAMACAFCATGTLGLARHMTAGEIVAQVHAAKVHARSVGRTITRLVFMGMGEPLHNHVATEAALRVLLDGHGLGFGSKQITVSTVGLPDRMRQLAVAFEGRIQLALSLHAGTDTTRQRIIPAARKAPLATLREVIHSWPLPGSRAIMIEYVVLPGVNDGPADLDGVAWFMDGVRGVVNLIPFNPFPQAPFRSPEDHEVLAVYQGLKDRGVLATVRWPRGRGAFGACGQLALMGAPEAT